MADVVEEIFDAAMQKISEKAEKAKAGAAFMQLMRHATLATSVKAGNRTGRPCSGPGSQDGLQLRHTKSTSSPLYPVRSSEGGRAHGAELTPPRVPRTVASTGAWVGGCGGS